MKKVITAIDVNAARKTGQTSLAVPDGALVTPQAADDAREYGIALVRGTGVGDQKGTLGPLCPALPKPGMGAPVRTVPVRVGGTSFQGAQSIAASPNRGGLPVQHSDMVEEVRRQVMARLGNMALPALDAIITSVLTGGGAGGGETGAAGSVKGFSGTGGGRAGGVIHAPCALLPSSGNVKGTPSAVYMVEVASPGSATPGLGYMSWENSSFTWTFQYAEALVVLEGEIVITSNGASVTAVAGDSLVIPANISVTLSAKGRVRCAYSAWPNPEPAKG